MGLNVEWSRKREGERPLVLLVSELEGFIGKNIRLACDYRARREDVKNIYPWCRYMTFLWTERGLEK